MRKTIILPALVLAVATFGFAGCADDTTTGDADTNVATDAGSQDGSNEQDGTNPSDTAAPGDTTPQDTAPADPCEPNPCTGQAPSCDGDTLTSYADGVCTNNEGAADCSYTETTTDCAADGNTCVNGSCVAAGDPSDYVFSEEASVMTSLGIGGVGELEPCCFDFTDDGEMDNALGKLLNGLGNILGDTDVNAEITTNMQEGGLVILLEYGDLNDVADDDSMQMAVFYGEDADDDYTDNLAGTGSFLVDTASFLEGTATPLASFPGTNITAGTMTAGPSVFNLAFPIGNIKLEAMVSGTLIEAPVTLGPNGKGLAMEKAKLGGYIRMEDLYGALNAYVTGSCECLGLGDEPLIGFDEAKGKMACGSTENSTCDSNNEDEETCAQLGSFCGAALLFLKPDVDSDGDGEKDAMSVGAWVSGTSATITGLAGE